MGVEVVQIEQPALPLQLLGEQVLVSLQSLPWEWRGLGSFCSSPQLAWERMMMMLLEPVLLAGHLSY